MFSDKRADDVRAEVDEFVATGRLHDVPAAILVATTAGNVGEVVGFVEVALHPVAHGATASPVACVEGLYVASTHRRLGLARRLLDAAADPEATFIGVAARSAPAADPEAESEELGMITAEPLAGGDDQIEDRMSGVGQRIERRLCRGAPVPARRQSPRRGPCGRSARG